MVRGNRVWCSLLVLAACTRLGPPAADGVLRVDGRSAEAFETSMRRIKDSLNGAEQSSLCDSALRLHGPVARHVLRSSGGDLEALQRALREQLHGMSVAEIHAAAALVPKSNQAWRRSTLLPRRGDSSITCASTRGRSASTGCRLDLGGAPRAGHLVNPTGQIQVPTRTTPSLPKN